MNDSEMFPSKAAGAASSSVRVRVNDRARYSAAASSKEDVVLDEEDEELCFNIRHGREQQSVSSDTVESINRERVLGVERDSGVSPVAVTALDNSEAKPRSTLSGRLVVGGCCCDIFKQLQ